MTGLVNTYEFIASFSPEHNEGSLLIITKFTKPATHIWKYNHESIDYSILLFKKGGTKFQRCQSQKKDDISSVSRKDSMRKKKFEKNNFSSSRLTV